MHASEPSAVPQVLVDEVLPPVPQSARLARKLVRDAACVLRFRTDDLALIATELVTNAIRHAGVGDVRLLMSLDRSRLYIEVIDRAPGRISVPFLGATDDPRPEVVAESGRGLLLITGLECVCGLTTRSDRDTKSVTAVIDVSLCA